MQWRDLLSRCSPSLSPVLAAAASALACGGFAIAASSPRPPRSAAPSSPLQIRTTYVEDLWCIRMTNRTSLECAYDH
ncbi:hypothetical protein AAHA92_33418 [Salvia divinorum]|uniref:Secreted protein n=1 Tax=Salvia divinorum TaxID=28513 RepID=A0ABD1FRY8_SALDI